MKNPDKNSRSNIMRRFRQRSAQRMSGNRVLHSPSVPALIVDCRAPGAVWWCDFNGYIIHYYYTLFCIR